MIPTFTHKAYDVVVIGAGHAGCEAAFATARLGLTTLLTTISMESIADLPCNPNIGGTGKGHLVREVDALGGEMALVIDQSYLQSRMLNTSKGPAIHSLRVQADKTLYHKEMKKRLEEQKNLTLRETEAVEICMEEGRISGVRMRTGMIVPAKAVILATGTYLRGLILSGELRYSSGPHGAMPSLLLSESLEKIGVSLRRFKTGTPARVHRDSIDYSNMEVQRGDEEFVPFSFMNFDNPPIIEQKDCYLTYTTPETKQIILDNLHRSTIASGGKYACFILFCTRSSSPLNCMRRRVWVGSCRTDSICMTSTAISLDRSSLVGPSPPVVNTMSDRDRLSLRACFSRFGLSPTSVIRYTPSPRRLSSCAIY
jgi:tRNA uridine 5-carboxymethylaminomethyl modification enzyme